MSNYQKGIFAHPTALAMYLTFEISDTASLADTLKAFAQTVDGENTVVGIGPTITQALGSKAIKVPPFPAYPSYPHAVPSVPMALWVWLRGTDRGELFHRSMQVKKILAPAFDVVETIDAYSYQGGKDLSNYTDGTANPDDAGAVTCAAIITGDANTDGGSIVAVQNWVHLFDRIAQKSETQMDNIMGRRLKDNQLIDEPPTAHAIRADQDAFSPRTTIWRNSMPWSDGEKGGLIFAAFNCSESAFNQQMARMAGQTDGIVDAILTISKPINGCFFWCPPMNANGTLNINALFL